MAHVDDPGHVVQRHVVQEHHQLAHGAYVLSLAGILRLVLHGDLHRPVVLADLPDGFHEMRPAVAVVALERVVESVVGRPQQNAFRLDRPGEVDGVFEQLHRLLPDALVGGGETPVLPLSVAPAVHHQVGDLQVEARQLPDQGVRVGRHRVRGVEDEQPRQPLDPRHDLQLLVECERVEVAAGDIPLGVRAEAPDVGVQLQRHESLSSSANARMALSLSTFLFQESGTSARSTRLMLARGSSQG